MYIPILYEMNIVVTKCSTTGGVWGGYFAFSITSAVLVDIYGTRSHYNLI